MDHRLRNAALFAAVGVGVFVYTVWTDTRAQWKSHKPIKIPAWMSDPDFQPTVLFKRPEYDYDRFEMELDR